MLNSIEIEYDHMKSKHKENMGELQTTSTNTVLDKVMLQIPLNTKLLLTAISEDNKQTKITRNAPSLYSFIVDES